MERINQYTLEQRAKQSALDLVPDMPKENTRDAWESYLAELESLDISDLAHTEADSWDWTIYHGKAMELCTNVSSMTLEDAEEQAKDCGAFEDVEGLYELACSLAYWIVCGAVQHALNELVEELTELAETQLKNMEG